MSMMGFLIINLNLFLETKSYPSDLKNDPPDLINVEYNSNGESVQGERAINFGAVHQFMMNHTFHSKTDIKDAITSRDINRTVMGGANASLNISQTLRKPGKPFSLNQTI